MNEHDEKRFSVVFTTADNRTFVECAHCGGSGRCQCNECLEAGGQPGSWSSIGCHFCHGTGVQEI